MKICVVFVGISLGLILAKRIPNFAGPYRVVVQRVSNESDEFNSTGKIWAELRVTHPRLRQLQYAWGTSANYIDLDDTIRAEVRIAKWANNQWKPNAFIMKFNRSCSAGFGYAPSLMPIWFGRAATKCPVKAVKEPRIIQNKTFDLKFPTVPVFPYGKWRFAAALFKGIENVAVLITEFETVPRL